MSQFGSDKFLLGHVVSTPAALRFCGLRQVDIFALLSRHARGDWGEMSNDDLLANSMALVDGSRIFSSYTFGEENLDRHGCG